MKRLTYIFTFAGLCLILTNCVGIKSLKDGERVLQREKIKGTKESNSEELYQLLQQVPNRKFPVSYTALYNRGKRNFDSLKVLDKKASVQARIDQKIAAAAAKDQPKKVDRLQVRKSNKIRKYNEILNEGNLLMRWGEPLAVYDSTLTLETQKQFTRYLNSKGFFDAEVNYEARKKGKKKILLDFIVNENEPYRIDSVSYETYGNTRIDTLLLQSRKKAQVVVNQNYDEEKLTGERERIFSLLRNNGFYNFERQYVEILNDSAIGEKKVWVNFIVNPKTNGDAHQAVTVDSIVFITDSGIKGITGDKTTKSYRGVDFVAFKHPYSFKLLEKKLVVEKDSYFSQNNTFDSQRNLSNLDIFKFINFNYDSLDGKFVGQIFASPLKKYQISQEGGVNVSQGFPGPFYRMNIKDRNLFGGLEILEFNGRVGIEGVPSLSDENRVYGSREYGFNFVLSIPKFAIPFWVDKESTYLFNRFTRFNLGYNFLDRPEYIRSNLNAAYAFRWQNKKDIIYNFTIADLNLINSTIQEQSFQDRLEELEASGNNLINSFKPAFVSSTSFSALFNSTAYSNFTNDASYLKLLIESGGTTQNKLAQSILSDSLEFYSYIKFGLDYRKFKPFERLGAVAFRINFGVAIPYGNNRVLPYEKYYFAGGSNSIRAWQPRRLGPGSYTPLNEDGTAVDYSFEQQGELLFETSVEFRRNVLGFIDGAIFIDAGNVWSLQSNDSRENSSFAFDRFYKEIAVGTGVGMRFNFSFLIMRLDYGIKVYDPAQAEGNRFIFSKNFRTGAFENQKLGVLNIGIGYPF